ncbi:MAG: hypothetical protein RI894_714 [Bacteroidota bacterium]|jgi:hypothetical protein
MKQVKKTNLKIKILIKTLLTFLVGNLLFAPCHAQCDNTKARELYLKNISIIHIFHESCEIHNLGEVIHAMKDLERISSIDSECDMTFLGRYNPTPRDARRWQAWYDVNKECLCIDKDTGKLCYVE